MLRASMRTGWRILAVTGLVLGAASGCAPEIGDECSSSVDCSVNGDRICDRSQPGGYCTVAACEEGTCPEDSVCVEFRFEPERLSSSWCMAPCEEDGDCRGGYDCRRASEILDADCEPMARALDGAGDSARFCAVEGNPSHCM